MMKWVDSRGYAGVPVVEMGIAFALAWGMVGLVLLSFAFRKCAKVVAEYDAAVAKAEAALDEDDAKPEVSPAPTGTKGADAPPATDAPPGVDHAEAEPGTCRPPETG
jgi:hypothetical protein